MPTHVPVEMNRTFHQLERVDLVYHNLMSFCDAISRLRLMQTSHQQLDYFSLNDDDSQEIDSDERFEQVDVKTGYWEYRRDKQRRIAKGHYLLALKLEIKFRNQPPPLLNSLRFYATTLIEGDYTLLFERPFMNHADRGPTYSVIINTNHTQLLKALFLKEDLNTISFMGNVTTQTDPSIAGLLLADRFIQGTSLAMVTDSRQTHMAMRRGTFFIAVSNALMYGLLYSSGLLKMALTTLLFALKWSPFFGGSLPLLLLALVPLLWAAFCLLKNLLTYALRYPGQRLPPQAAKALNEPLLLFLGLGLIPLVVNACCLAILIPLLGWYPTAMAISSIALPEMCFLLPLISFSADILFWQDIAKLNLFNADAFQIAYGICIDKILTSKVGLFLHGLLTLPIFLLGCLGGEFFDKEYRDMWTEALGFRKITWKPYVIPLSISPSTQSLFDLSKSIIDQEIKTNQRLTPNAQWVCLLRQYLNQGVVVSLFKGKKPHSDFVKQLLRENQKDNFTIEKVLYLFDTLNLDSRSQLGAIRNYVEYVLLPMEEKLNYTQVLNANPWMAGDFIRKTIPLLTMEERECIIRAGSSENNPNFGVR